MRAIQDVVVPARKGWAAVIRKGQHLRIIEVEGGQVGDFVVFNADNLRERLSQARTKANQGKFLVTKGDVLYSKSNNVLMRIVEDIYGIHDLQYGMCSSWIYTSGKYQGYTDRFTVGGPLGRPSFGCWEILQEALAPWDIPAEDIPDPLNIFQKVWFDMKTGRMGVEDGASKPSDYIDLKAEMNVLCALSACPGTGHALRVLHYEEEEGGGESRKA